MDILHLAAPCRNVPVTFTLDRMRQIYAHERPLIEALLEAGGIRIDVGSLLVEPMKDGEMGSLAFAPLERLLGETASECQFTDSDGVLVHAVLNLDREGKPLELDVWKVNFEPLVRWPEKQDMEAVSCDRRPTPDRR